MEGVGEVTVSRYQEQMGGRRVVQSPKEDVDDDSFVSCFFSICKDCKMITDHVVMIRLSCLLPKKYSETSQDIKALDIGRALCMTGIK